MLNLQYKYNYIKITQAEIQFDTVLEFPTKFSSHLRSFFDLQFQMQVKIK